MGHRVDFSIEIGDQQWHESKDKLPKGIYQDIETHRELAIMHEVMKAEGNSLDEKLNNTAYAWSNDKSTPVVKLERYKLRYKYYEA